MASPSIFAPAETRISHALTAGAERRLLIWIARRLPDWVHSDLLTLLGLGGQLVAGICYGFASRRPWCLILVGLFLAFNWFGDSLDGTVARVGRRAAHSVGARRILLFDLGGIIGAAGMSDLAAITAVRHAAELRRGGV